jgi:hypothetical protein
MMTPRSILCFASLIGSVPSLPACAGGDDGHTFLGPPVVELGTGFQYFEPLSEGQKVEIIFGPQGGYHVWVHFRMQNMVPEDLLLTFTGTLHGTLDDSDPPACSAQYLVRELVVLEEPWHQLDDGVPCFVADPEGIQGRHMLLQVVATDGEDRTASDACDLLLE